MLRTRAIAQVLDRARPTPCTPPASPRPRGARGSRRPARPRPRPSGRSRRGSAGPGPRRATISSAVGPGEQLRRAGVAGTARPRRRRPGARRSRRAAPSARSGARPAANATPRGPSSPRRGARGGGRRAAARRPGCARRRSRHGRTSSGPDGPSRTSQPARAQLVAQPVGLGEVPRRARLLAGAQQRLAPRRPPRLPRRRAGSRGRGPPSISARSSRPTPLARVRLADPLERRRQRAPAC